MHTSPLRRRSRRAIDRIDATAPADRYGDQRLPPTVDTAFRQAHSCAEMAGRGQATCWRAASPRVLLSAAALRADRRAGWPEPWSTRTGACAPRDRRSGCRRAPAPGSRACRAAGSRGRRRTRTRRPSSARPGASSIRARRVAVRHVVEEERDRHVQDLAELVQPRRADPVDAALVLLDLLEGQARAADAEPLLAHAEQRAPQAQPAADVHVDRIGLVGHSRRSSCRRRRDGWPRPPSSSSSGFSLSC